MITSTKESIKQEIIELLKQYPHGLPTYNEQFKTQLIRIIDNNFTKLSDYEGL
tara:strand:+ start:244 stop:402 length:159 start_codon:yes stop_codon:yes gene_type:complete